MNVAEAKVRAVMCVFGKDSPQLLEAARVLSGEVDRLEAQLDSVRAELAATAARIAAWDQALDACLPALHDQMTPTPTIIVEPDYLYGKPRRKRSRKAGL